MGYQLAYTIRYPIPPAQLSSPNIERNLRNSPGNRVETSTLKKVARYTKDDRWQKRHSNVHFHFIPTYSSWLNQVECWFSILSRQALQGASFTSPQQLRQAIDAFVEVYNQNAAPF